MGRFFVGCLAIIGTLTLLFIGGIVWLVVSFWPEEGVEPIRRAASGLPDKLVLKLELSGPLAEQRASTPLGPLDIARNPGLDEIVFALFKAAEDERVVGLYVDASAVDLGMAEAQELRDAVTRVRSAGKKTVIFADSLDGPGWPMTAGYFATAFEERWMQPSGSVALTGFHIETPFLKRILNHYGIVAEFSQREAYKGAADMFTETGLTPEQRETLGNLLDDWMTQVTTDIGRDLQKSPEDIRRLINQAPLLARDAQAADLITELGYQDEALASIETEETNSISLTRYAAGLDDDADGPVVALIVGVGPVSEGFEEPPFFDEPSLTADRITRAFEEAMEDDDVDAILFRVDSPGGSYVASDTIWRVVERARGKGKKVVVTMGDIAASGGYFVAAPADRIVAAPGTITGSIGIVAGKFVIEELSEDLRIDWDTISRGRNAGMWSSLSPFDPAERARFEAFLDAAYDDFKGKVAAGRNLDQAAVDRVAGGRIWSGSDAFRNGLVDRLGGYAEALAEIRLLLGLDLDADLTVKRYPLPRDPWDLLSGIFGGGGLQVASDLQRLSRAVPILERFDQWLQISAGEPRPIRAEASEPVKEAGR